MATAIAKMSSFLTSAQRETLAALCRCIVPDAFTPAEPVVDLARVVETRIAESDPVLRRQLALLLTVLGHPATSLLFARRPQRFARLPGPVQDRVLRGWEASRVAVRRTIFQAFRKLILSSYYSLPASHLGIGFRGPLHTREAAVAWEGVLPGISRDDEPVARMPLPSRSSHRNVAVGREGIPPGVVQGADVRRDATIRAEVCVVGSGAGGAVVAARLAEAGYDVVILEEGGYWTSGDFTEDEAEMVPRLYAERGLRATEDLALSLLQGRAVGGGTTANWMIMLRTPEWVLDEWARASGTEGMTPSDLAPVFDLIEEEVHASVVPGDAHAPNNRIILDGAERLGWSAVPARINAKGCVRAGFCGIGCRYGAKQSALVTYVPRALAAGARLHSDVRVEGIEVKPSDGKLSLKRVRAMVLDRETGDPRHELIVESPIVVLAAGAVGTPAILQRSGMGGGGVGRFLRLHPTSAVIGVYDREMYGSAGIPQSAIADGFLRGGAAGDFGFWIECPPMLPGLAAAALPGFGREHRDVMRSFANLGTLIVLTRDGADPKRSDGEVAVTRSGRARVRYRMADANWHTMIDGLSAAARLHLAAGATEVRTLQSPAVVIRSADDVDAVAGGARGPNRIGLFSAHVNGTCRIGTDPRSSGCAPDGQRHGTKGVYVADGSLLPSAPAVNPQETIMAMGTVIARRIMENHPAGR